MAWTDLSAAELVLETVACDLCGSRDADPVMRLRDRLARTTDAEFALVRCRRCGLHYLSPRPAQETLGHFYPDDYAPFARRGIAARVKAYHVRREVAALWDILRPPARVLDVGCATGDLLQAVRERGNLDVLGVEPSQRAARLARERYGLEVFAGDLGEARLPAASVDVALLSHVIEHLPSPSATLVELRRVLRPGGTLVLWLPNAASIAARVFGESWIGYDAPRHLYDFTPATLSALLERHGFEVRQVRHEWIGLEWSSGLRLWVEGRWGEPAARVLARLHPALTAALTPVAAAAALARRAGRIRVVAGMRE